MAISFVNANTASGTATNLVLTRPTSTSNGDMLLVAVELFDGGNVIDAIAGTGWTVLDIVKNTASGNAHSLATLWRLDNGSATYTFTWGGSSQFRTGQILAYTGGATIVDVHSLAADTNNASTTMRGPSVTTTRANAMVVLMGAKGNVGTQTPPSGMTERVDTVRHYAADVAQAVAGATGNKDSTLAAGDANIGGLVVISASTATVTGAGTLTSTLSGAAVGVRKRLGAGTMTSTLSGAAAGRQTSTTGGTGHATFSGAAAGRNSAVGGATLTSTLSASAAGYRTARTGGSLQAAFSAAAAGRQTARTGGNLHAALSAAAAGFTHEYASGTVAATLSGSAAGVRKTFGAGTLGAALSAAAAGRQTVLTGGSLQSGLSFVAIGSRVLIGSGNLSILLALQASPIFRPEEQPSLLTLAGMEATLRVLDLTNHLSLDEPLDELSLAVSTDTLEVHDPEPELDLRNPFADLILDG